MPGTSLWGVYSNNTHQQVSGICSFAFNLFYLFLTFNSLALLLFFLLFFLSFSSSFTYCLGHEAPGASR